MSNPKPLGHTALPSSAGTLFQIRRFVITMIEEWPTRTRFEVLDDFDIETRQGRVVEQNKLSVKAEPITDESEDIWKTLSNWLDVEHQIELSAEPAINLYRIVTNSPDPGPNSLAHILSRTDLSGDLKLTKLVEVSQSRAERLRKSPPAPPSKPSSPKKIEKPPHIERVMEAGHRDRLVKLLGKTSILFSEQATWSSDPQQTTLMRRFLRLKVDDDPWPVVAQLHHWVVARLLDRAMDRRDVEITSDELAEQLHAILSTVVKPERKVRSKLRIGLVEREQARVSTPLGVTPLFEKRLRVIGANDRLIDGARETFVLHLAEMRYQSHHGHIVTSSPDIAYRDDIQYYADLYDRWSTIHNIACSSIADDPSANRRRKGLEILSTSLERAAQANLTIGKVAIREAYFSEGAYHVLANGHHAEYEVWWYPNDAPIDNDPPPVNSVADVLTENPGGNK